MSANCPICKSPIAAETANRPKWFPFCSERCRQIDLLRWSNGKYAIVEQLSAETLEQELANENDDESV